MSESWQNRQTRTFTNWINSKIAPRDLAIEDIFQDLRDGIILYNLLEILSGQSLAALGKLTPGQTQIHRNVNMSIVFRYLQQTIKMVGIGPADIVSGQPVLTLGLIWSIIMFFVGKDIGEVDLKAFKAKVLRWAKKMTAAYPDVQVNNLTTSFADGKAFNAILNRVSPHTYKYAHKATPAANLAKAFEHAHAAHGIANLLDPNDPECCGDEKSMLTYLAEMMTKLPPAENFDENEVSSAIQEMNRTPEQRAAGFLDGNKGQMVDDLTALCGAHSIPEDAAGCNQCAQAIADIIAQRGLPTAVILAPTDAAEDVSGTGAPFVLTSVEGPADAPTILLYASYGVDSDGAGAAGWTHEPFVGEVSDNRLNAAGSDTKADVVAALAALQGVIKACESAESSLPATIRVLVGPSISTGAGGPSDAQREAGDKLHAFLQNHADQLGSPDVVIITAPGGSLLAPDTTAVQFGAKGEASVRVFVRTFARDDISTPSNPFSAVCLDASQVLFSALSALRERSGALNSAIPRAEINEYVRDNLRDVPFTATQFSEHTSYSATQLVLGSNLAETICFGTGVAISEVVVHSNGDNTLSTSASCKISICTPPNLEASAVLSAVEEILRSNVMAGAELTLSEQTTKDGWFYNPEHSVLPLLKQGIRNSFKKAACSAVSPVFEPVSAAFAQALRSSQIFLMGIHDSAAHLHEANENVAINDMLATAKVTSRLVFNTKDARAQGYPATLPEPVANAPETKTAETKAPEAKATTTAARTTAPAAKRDGPADHKAGHKAPANLEVKHTTADAKHTHKVTSHHAEPAHPEPQHVEPACPAPQHAEPAPHAETPAEAPAHQDEKPAACPVHHEDKPAECPAHHDEKPAECPAHHDEKPAECPAHHDEKPAECPAHHDEKPAECPAHHGEKPAECPAHHDHAALPEGHPPVDGEAKACPYSAVFGSTGDAAQKDIDTLLAALEARESRKQHDHDESAASHTEAPAEPTHQDVSVEPAPVHPEEPVAPAHHEVPAHTEEPVHHEPAPVVQDEEPAPAHHDEPVVPQPEEPAHHEPVHHDEPAPAHHDEAAAAPHPEEPAHHDEPAAAPHPEEPVHHDEPAAAPHPEEPAHHDEPAVAAPQHAEPAEHDNTAQHEAPAHHQEPAHDAPAHHEEPVHHDTEAPAQAEAHHDHDHSADHSEHSAHAHDEEH